MALDTTIGGASSDSYASLAEFKAYAESMGFDLTGAYVDADYVESDYVSDGGIETCLRRAVAYMDRSFSWLGYPATSSQALKWPQDIDELVEGYSVPPDSIPKDIKDAQCEFAYQCLSGVDLFYSTDGRTVSAERSKAGPVEVETEYLGAQGRKTFSAGYDLVKPYTDARFGAGAVRVYRS